MITKLVKIKNYFSPSYLKEYFRKNVLTVSDSNKQIAMAVALGVFMGIVPLWGWQIATSIALAHLFKLNKTIVFLGTNISFPPLIPFVIYYCYMFGGFILGVENDLEFSYNLTFDSVKQYLLQYIVGSVSMSVIAALVIGSITFVVLNIFRKKKND